MRNLVCLVCEDEALIALDLEDCLEEAGIAVAGPFSSTCDALAWAGDHTPDVAILDFELADGACMPLIRALRERQVPVVIHSGWQPDEADLPADLHGLPWLAKPMERTALLKAVMGTVARQPHKEDTDALPLSLSALTRPAPDRASLSQRRMTRTMIERLGRLAPLGSAEREALIQAVSRTVSVTDGQDIVQTGARPENCHVLLSGMAAAYKSVPNGKRQIVAFHVPGDIMDLDGFHGGRMDHGVVALSSCQFGVIPHRAMHDLSAEYPGIAQALWRHAVSDGAVSREWVVNVGQRAAPVRIAHLVCEVCTKLQDVGLVIEISGGRQFLWPVTQVDIADATGMSAVHVNRSLQDLRGRELIQFASGQMTILDWAALKRLAGFEADYLHPGVPRQNGSAHLSM